MTENSHLYPSPRPKQDGSGGATQWVVFILAGGLAGYFFAYFELTVLNLLVMLLMALLAVWLQTLIHEAGHVIAGSLGGKRLIAAGMGPLRLLRVEEGWRLQWAGSLQGIGGFAAMYTPHGKFETRGHTAVFILGGPLANLFAVGIGLIVLFGILPETTVLRQFLYWQIGIGLVFAVVNLLPLRVAGWCTDGRNLLSLLRDDSTIPFQLKLSQLIALSMAGVRPRDWPENLIPTNPTESDPAEQRIAIHCFRMELALDTGDGVLAEECAKELAPKLWDMPDGQRQGIAVLIALHAAWFLEDRDLLEAWLSHIQGGLVKPECARAVLEAESSRLAGDRRTMLQALNRAEAALPSVIDKASRQQFQERIADLTRSASLDEAQTG